MAQKSAKCSLHYKENDGVFYSAMSRVFSGCSDPAGEPAEAGCPSPGMCRA